MTDQTQTATALSDDLILGAEGFSKEPGGRWVRYTPRPGKKDPVKLVIRRCHPNVRGEDEHIWKLEAFEELWAEGTDCLEMYSNGLIRLCVMASRAARLWGAAK